MNIWNMFLDGNMLSLLFGKYLEVGLLGHRIDLEVTFRTTEMESEWVTLIFSLNAP